MLPVDPSVKSPPPVTSVLCATLFLRVRVLFLQNFAHFSWWPPPLLSRYMTRRSPRRRSQTPAVRTAAGHPFRCWPDPPSVPALQVVSFRASLDFLRSGTGSILSCKFAAQPAIKALLLWRRPFRKSLFLPSPVFFFAAPSLAAFRAITPFCCSCPRCV